MTPEVQERLAAILTTLDQRDVLAADYPPAARSTEDRRRWNQACLVALALHHVHEPSMLPGEFTQSVYMLAGSVYDQNRTEFPTGTEEELAEDVAEAVERGWL